MIRLEITGKAQEEMKFEQEERDERQDINQVRIMHMGRYFVIHFVFPIAE